MRAVGRGPGGRRRLRLRGDALLPQHRRGQRPGPSAPRVSRWASRTRLGNDLLILVPGEPDTLFVARDKSLLRSRDGGLIWQSVDIHPETAISSLMVDRAPLNPSSPVPFPRRRVRWTSRSPVASSAASMEATPGRRSRRWSPPFPGRSRRSPPGFRAQRPAGLADHLLRPRGYGLYRSVDAGASWESVAPAPPPGDGYCHSFGRRARLAEHSLLPPGRAGDDGYAHDGV